MPNEQDERDKREQPRPQEPKRATGTVPALSAEQKRATGTMPALSPGKPASPPLQSSPTPLPQPSAPLAPRAMTAHQKHQLDSGFVDAEAERRRRAMLGTGAPARPSAEVKVPTVSRKFDGLTPAPEVISRDVWKALAPPVTSQIGARTVNLTRNVIAQFAVGTNPRYEPDAGKPRGHIFLWDVTRAMGCEVPHFVGAKELGLAQTIDWVRHEGPMRGWHRVSDFDLFTVSQTGVLIIALPRDVKVKQLGIVEPQEQAPDNKPRLTGAGLKRGPRLTMMELIGARLADYFAHD